MRKLYVLLPCIAAWPSAMGGFVAPADGMADSARGVVAPVASPIAYSVLCPFGFPGRSVYGPETGLPLEEAGAVETAPMQLPSPPSSLALGLSALAGFGLFHAGRTIRKVQFGSVPEWYHEHARPVGHSTPLDLERVVLPVCILDPLVDLATAAFHRFRADPDVGPPVCLIPRTAAPRGPPLLAHSEVFQAAVVAIRPPRGYEVGILGDEQRENFL